MLYKILHEVHEVYHETHEEKILKEIITNAIKITSQIATLMSFQSRIKCGINSSGILRRIYF